MIILTDRQYREILDRIETVEEKLRRLKDENSIIVWDVLSRYPEARQGVLLKDAVYAIAAHLNLHLSAKRGEPEKAASIVLQPIPAQQPQSTQKPIKRNRNNVK